jgi:hypothetical protein
LYSCVPCICSNLLTYPITPQTLTTTKGA